MIAGGAGRGDGGFTLIEVLVAFAIVSLCLATLYNAVGGNARQTALADMHRQTLAFAQDQLERFDEAGAGPDAAPGGGTYANGTRWRMAISPIAVGGAAPDATARPFLVTLSVYDRAGKRLVSLNTVKILPAAR